MFVRTTAPHYMVIGVGLKISLKLMGFSPVKITFPFHFAYFGGLFIFFSLRIDECTERPILSPIFF